MDATNAPVVSATSSAANLNVVVDVQPTVTTAPMVPANTQANSVPPRLTSLANQKRSFKSPIVLEQQSEMRRASKRPIKRKRFDDEIVDYSSPIQQPRNTSSDLNRSRSRAVVQSVQAQSMQAPPILLVPTQSTQTAVSEISPAIKVNAIEDAGVSTSAPVVQTTQNVAALPPLTDTKPQTSLSTVRSATTVGGSQRRANNPKTANKRQRRHVQRQQNATPYKALGRWKPIDDLALIIAVQQTNDLKLVHRGVKFSCKFTYPEILNRWSSLLYDSAISRLAVAAMRNLHPEMIRSVQAKAPFSVQEEELLGTITSNSISSSEKTESKLAIFEELLRQNAAVFYVGRTPQSLFNYWQLLKLYHLLPDQSVKSHDYNLQPLSFSDAEEQPIENEPEPRCEELIRDMAMYDNLRKRQERHVENELQCLDTLVETKFKPDWPPEFQSDTLAVLKGEHVRYLISSKELSFGRPTKNQPNDVDIDLSCEGATTKISRRQGTIKMRSNGDFFISNEGKRPIYVDGFPLLQGDKTRLFHDAIIDIVMLHFRFIINFDLVSDIRKESAKTSNPLI